MGHLYKSMPFVTVIGLNVLAQASRYKLDMLKPFALIFTIVLILNLFGASKFKKLTYFTVGISAVAITGNLFILGDLTLGNLALGNLTLGQFYAEHIIEGLYLGLFLVALLPPLFKMNPFTYEFSQERYPKAITEGEAFLKINLILNWVWAGIFAAAIILTAITYHPDQAINTIIATLVPLALQLVVGIPVTKKHPDFLMRKTSGTNYQFKTVEDLFQAMPFGLNRNIAKRIWLFSLHLCIFPMSPGL